MSSIPQPGGRTIPGLRDIRNQSKAVVSSHLDPSTPDKPLYLLIPGALLAVIAFIVMIMIAFGMAQETIALEIGLAGGLPVLFIYFMGLLMFSYAYCEKEWGKTIRMTLIAGAIGIAVVVMCYSLTWAVRALFGIGGAKASGSFDSDGDSSSSSESKNWNLSLNYNEDSDDEDDGKITQLGISQGPIHRPLPREPLLCPQCQQRASELVMGLCPSCLTSPGGPR